MGAGGIFSACGCARWRGASASSEDLDKELRFHLEQQTEENLAAGMPPD